MIPELTAIVVDYLGDEYINYIHLMNYYKLNDKRYNLKIPSLVTCIEYCNLEYVIYYSNKKHIFTTDAMDIAAGNGQLNIVKWLHENRTEGCTTDAMDYAAMNGHLDIVKWLHANRIEGCTIYAIHFASHNGHLDIAKWLTENINI